jgi:hypothetical protein
MISQEHLVRITLAVARRRYAPLYDRFREDCRQEAYLLVLSQRGKHLTVKEQFRRADRHFYAMAKRYGFRRTYQPGNRKTALQRDRS